MKTTRKFNKLQFSNWFLKFTLNAENYTSLQAQKAQNLPGMLKECFQQNLTGPKRYTFEDIKSSKTFSWLKTSEEPKVACIIVIEVKIENNREPFGPWVLFRFWAKINEKPLWHLEKKFATFFIEIRQNTNLDIWGYPNFIIERVDFLLQPSFQFISVPLEQLKFFRIF